MLGYCGSRTAFSHSGIVLKSCNLPSDFQLPSCCLVNDPAGMVLPGLRQVVRSRLKIQTTRAVDSGCKQRDGRTM
jgi:hypothetical protein